MLEIEIRAKANSLDNIRKKLGELSAKKIGVEKQVDKIFGRPKDRDEENKIIEGRFSARIRQKENKILTELKEIRRNGAGLEFSSPVQKIEDGVRLLESLDYEESFTISKTRELYELENCEICLDQVDKLGNFIEIECKSTESGNTEELLDKCKSLLSKIDPEATLESRKYGDLMQELINNE
jgi:adenylate cyclase, class 2